MDVPLDQLIFNHILGLVQNAIVKNTDEDVVVQRDGLFQRMIPIIEAAALAKVNVLCFQEAWSKKFMNFLMKLFPSPKECDKLLS